MPELRWKWIWWFLGVLLLMGHFYIDTDATLGVHNDISEVESSSSGSVRSSGTMVKQMDLPKISQASGVSSGERRGALSRRKRDILFPNGVKLCSQETVKQALQNHLEYFHLRVCQETVWEAFKIFWDRLPEKDEYQLWINRCQNGSVTVFDIGRSFSQSAEHITLVTSRVAIASSSQQTTPSTTKPNTIHTTTERAETITSPPTKAPATSLQGDSSSNPSKQTTVPPIPPVPPVEMTFPETDSPTVTTAQTPPQLIPATSMAAGLEVTLEVTSKPDLTLTFKDSQGISPSSPTQDSGQATDQINPGYELEVNQEATGESTSDTSTNDQSLGGDRDEEAVVILEASTQNPQKPLEAPVDSDLEKEPPAGAEEPSPVEPVQVIDNVNQEPPTGGLAVQSSPSPNSGNTQHPQPSEGEKPLVDSTVQAGPGDSEPGEAETPVALTTPPIESSVFEDKAESDGRTSGSGEDPNIEDDGYVVIVQDSEDDDEGDYEEDEDEGEGKGVITSEPDSTGEIQVMEVTEETTTAKEEYLTVHVPEGEETSGTVVVLPESPTNEVFLEGNTPVVQDIPVAAIEVGTEDDPGEEIPEVTTDAPVITSVDYVFESHVTTMDLPATEAVTEVPTPEYKTEAAVVRVTPGKPAGTTTEALEHLETSSGTGTLPTTHQATIEADVEADDKTEVTSDSRVTPEEDIVKDIPETSVEVVTPEVVTDFNIEADTLEPIPAVEDDKTEVTPDSEGDTPEVIPDIEDGTPEVIPDSEGDTPDVTSTIEDSSPEVIPDSEDNAPTPITDVEDDTPKVKPDSEGDTPEVTPTIEDSSPKVIHDVEDDTPKVIPDSEDGTTEVIPDIEDSTPVVSPEFKDDTPAVTTNTEVSTPVVIPDSEDGTPEVIPDSEDGTPKVIPGSEDGTPEVSPDSEDDTPEVIHDAKDDVVEVIPNSKDQSPEVIPETKVDTPDNTHDVEDGAPEVISDAKEDDEPLLVPDTEDKSLDVVIGVEEGTPESKPAETGKVHEEKTSDVLEDEILVLPGSVVEENTPLPPADVEEPEHTDAPEAAKGPEATEATTEVVEDTTVTEVHEDRSEGPVGEDILEMTESPQDIPDITENSPEVTEIPEDMPDVTEAPEVLGYTTLSSVLHQGSPEDSPVNSPEEPIDKNIPDATEAPTLIEMPPDSAPEVTTEDDSTEPPLVKVISKAPQVDDTSTGGAGETPQTEDEEDTPTPSLKLEESTVALNELTTTIQRNTFSTPLQTSTQEISNDILDENNMIGNEIGETVPRPVRPMVDHVVELSIKLKGEIYDDALRDPSSFYYQRLSEQFIEKIEDAFEKLPGFKSVFILEFRPQKDIQGGLAVVVHYAIVLEVDGAGINNETMHFITLQSNTVEKSYSEPEELPTVVYTITDFRNFISEALHKETFGNNGNTTLDVDPDSLQLESGNTCFRILQFVVGFSSG
uniref:SEA domain-containing protein n=1 Tax=Astyanax mexicanus TaxID=7994 RepID=A0A8B9JJ31_ASTMX